MKKKVVQKLRCKAIIILVIPFLYHAAFADKPVKLTILHTNDIHAQYLPTKARGLGNEPEIGGLEALSYYVKSEREKDSNTLLLDAGDLMTGSPICDIEYMGAYGGDLVAMMNRIGYDGMVPGNHDFDISVTNFKALEKIAEFPLLCANMLKDKIPLSNEACHIYDVGGLKVGVIGITYHPMRGMVAGPNLEGYDSLDPEMILDSLITEIDPETDVVIVLSHMGLDYDRRLAQSAEGLDLIIGGHNHMKLETPEIISGVPIVQAGSNCQFLGRIELTIENDSVIEFEGGLIPMFTGDIKRDSQVSATVSRISSGIDGLYGKVIGRLENRWEVGFGQETNAGDWITDAIRKRVNADVAVINSGAIRKSLGPGNITVKDILEMLPFDNEVVTFKCSGRQLELIAEQNSSCAAEGYLYPLQISGMTFTWRETGSGNQLAEIEVQGRTLDEDRVYAVASIDYVVIYNAARYFGFDITDYEMTGLRLTDLVIDGIKKAGIVKSAVEGRFKKID